MGLLSDLDRVQVQGQFPPQAGSGPTLRDSAMAAGVPGT